MNSKIKKEKNQYAGFKYPFEEAIVITIILSIIEILNFNYYLKIIIFFISLFISFIIFILKQKDEISHSKTVFMLAILTISLPLLFINNKPNIIFLRDIDTSLIIVAGIVAALINIKSDHKKYALLMIKLCFITIALSFISLEFIMFAPSNVTNFYIIPSFILTHISILFIYSAFGILYFILDRDIK